MARSPFQGTFQPNARQVVVTAPDAIVLINNSTQVVGCPTCNSSFDINKYITSIQVDLSIDSVPGSASISLSVPRHTIDDFYFDNVPVISPMMEVNIYAKGYYLVEGLPQYYPIFWGLVTEVSDSYSSGEHSVAIHCSDILKWWELCKMNVNPAYTSPVPSKFGITLNGNVFSGANPFDIIWTLAQQAYGDIVIGGGSLVTLTTDSPQRPVFMAALSDIMAYWSQRFQAVSRNLMLYGSSGVAVRGDVLQEKQFNSKNAGADARTLASKTVRMANGGDEGAQLLYDPTDPSVTSVRTNNASLGVNFWQSEFQTKLEIANAAKEAIGYEFYMDTTGDIVFKPPFYNLDILSNKPVSWIQDIDIIEWDFSDSEAEVVTQLTIQGNYSGNTDWGWPAEMTPFTNVTDYHLLRKYGWRPQQVNSEFMGNNALHMFYYGLDLLDKMNSRRHRGTVTIPFRPELRMGFPIYIAPKDQIWYIQGISHNISFGGRATTTLTLTARREKFKAPQGIGTLVLTNYNPSAAKPGTGTNPGKANLAGAGIQYTGAQLSDGGTFLLKAGDAAEVPAYPVDLTAANPNSNPYQPLILRDPQSGRILGYPNVVMAYLQPYAGSIGDWEDVAGVGNTSKRVNAAQRQKVIENQTTAAQQQLSRVTADAYSKITDKHLTNRSWFGLTSAGTFVYAHDIGKANSPATQSQTQGVIGELVLVPAGKLNTATSNTTDTTPKVKNATTMIRPVSDERGFEVIGHYRYGRGLSLSDGQLIQVGGQDNYQAANVSIQVALSGDLFASLTAQSQGLTSLTYSYPNPVNALAQLQPDDLRTSGFTTPSVDGTSGLGQASYGNTQTNFANLPVLGSPQQRGVYPSVEASELAAGLTLAEMTVVDQLGSQDGTSSGQPQCSCLLGRSDLAFISTGYKLLPTIAGTVEDPTSLYNPNAFAAVGSPQIAGGTSQPSQAQQQALDLLNQISAAQQKVQLDQVQLQAAQQSGDQALIQQAQQALAADQAQFDSLNSQYQALQASSAKAGSSVSPSLASLSPDQVTTIIDDFLFNLYMALDTPHQQYEAELRGGSYQAPQPGSNGTLQVGPNSALGNFPPPFSPTSRFATGDPNAIAQQAETSAANISQAWNSFGQNLQANTQIAALSTQLSSDQNDLAQLQAQLTRTQASLTPQQVASLQQQITKLQQKIASESLQLQQLRAKQAQGTQTPNAGGNAG
jgi:hypothetical protein